MTPISAIITDAYRESNLIMIGQAPSPEQQQEGLARLTSLIAAVYGWEVGEELKDWMIGSAGILHPFGWSQISWRFPIENSRLILNNTEADTIYLPENPRNGSRVQVVDVAGNLATAPITLDGNGRLIQGQRTLLLNQAGVNDTWMFNKNNSEWEPVPTIDISSTLPFPPEFDDYFIIKLAARINPAYGRSLNDLSISRLSEATEQLIARYRQTRTMPVPLGLRRLNSPRSFYGTDDQPAGRFGWMR
jgi:hypothetical protein